MNFQKVPLEPGLIFVGVPIGAARDITLRALDVLASADLLAAEDTRSLRKLMDIHGVPLDGRRIESLHEHTGSGKIDRLVEAVRSGRSLAYASEAGMPLIADPGFELAGAMIDAGLKVSVAPGPSALPAALAVAGLPTDRVHFAGFLPSALQARRRALEGLAHLQATLVLYESPKRLPALLKDACEIFGSTRRAAICRELTKKFEEVLRGDLETLCAQVTQAPPKGEIVVLFERAPVRVASAEEIETALKTALETQSLRDASSRVAEDLGVARKMVYRMGLDLVKTSND